MIIEIYAQKVKNMNRTKQKAATEVAPKQENTNVEVKLADRQVALLAAATAGRGYGDPDRFVPELAETYLAWLRRDQK